MKVRSYQKLVAGRKQNIRTRRGQRQTFGQSTGFRLERCAKIPTMMDNAVWSFQNEWQNEMRRGYDDVP